MQSGQSASFRDLLLHYDRPAREAITEGLPLGNGHIDQALSLVVAGGEARQVALKARQSQGIEL